MIINPQKFLAQTYHPTERLWYVAWFAIDENQCICGAEHFATSRFRWLGVETLAQQLRVIYSCE